MGRKTVRSRDSEATRTTALDAAQRLFAEKGFAGASMREIASVSGISQPLIHYHFGSKEGLYSAVKERLMKEGLRSILPGPDSSEETSPAKLIRATYDFVSGNESLMRLVAWSHLEREYNPWPGEEEHTLLVAECIRRYMSAIPSGRKIDPILATIMIEALVLFWSQNRHYFARLFDEPLEEVTENYLRNIGDLFFPGTKEKDKE